MNHLNFLEPGMRAAGRAGRLELLTFLVAGAVLRAVIPGCRVLADSCVGSSQPISSAARC